MSEKMKYRFFGFNLVKNYCRIYNWLFYKEIIVEGQENIPKDGPIFFAPNHQNALMDPLAVAFTTKRQIFFLARADLFNNSFIASLMRFIHVIPVYRVRDGYANLKNNDKTFDMSVDVLKHNYAIGIFPEARHNNKRFLLPLKKAIPRIAFKAEAENDFKLGVKIVPVGINYSEYTRSRSTIHLKYGKPIDVSEYKELYLQNESSANAALRDRMAEELHKLMIDIQSKEYYDTIYTLLDLYDTEKGASIKKKTGKLTENIKLVDILTDLEENDPKKMNSLSDLVSKHKKLAKKSGLPYNILRDKTPNLFRLIAYSALLLISLPVFLYGFINSFVPYIIAKSYAQTMKDKQFLSSLKYGLSLVLFPLFYFIQTLLLGIFTDHWYIWFAYLLSVAPLFYFARVWKERFQRLRGRWIYFNIKTNHKDKVQLLRDSQTKIKESIDEI